MAEPLYHRSFSAAELDRTIHDFAALSGFFARGEGRSLFGWIMDSQSRAFEADFGAAPRLAATPLPCPRRMAPQSLAPASPARILLRLMAMLLPVQPRRVPALIKRRR